MTHDCAVRLMMGLHLKMSSEPSFGTENYCIREAIPNSKLYLSNNTFQSGVVVGTC
jgi:hypothetical protein